MSETKPWKLDRIKTGVPEWFDRNNYEVFWTTGASVWLEQLEIRRELKFAVQQHRNDPALPSTLVESVELLRQRPYVNYRDLPWFGCNGESYSSPLNPSNWPLPSGTRLLTNCEFWLMAAWLYLEEGDNPASEAAKEAAQSSRTSFKSAGIREYSDDDDSTGDDDLYVEHDESSDAEWLLDAYADTQDATMDEYEGPPSFDNDFPDYFEALAARDSKFAKDFYIRMRKCGYCPGEGDKPLPTVEVLGAKTFLVSVDLNLPDSILKEQFETVLEEKRRQTRIVAQEAKRPAIRNWMKAGVLPYLDLTLWAAVTNHWIPNAALADAVLVGETQGSDTIRNTTEVHVKQLMERSSAAYRGLISAARLEASGLA